MTSRLTAWILAFCIGLPMCWCCAASPSAAAQVETKRPDCCAKHQPQERGERPTSNNDGTPGHCPCLNHEDNRDTPDATVAVPAPMLKLLATPALVETAVAGLPRPSHFVQHPARHDHGPPGVARPLYARHCALLL